MKREGRNANPGACGAGRAVGAKEDTAKTTPAAFQKFFVA